ncbi:MAG: ETC complex I subunit [Methylocystis sp.]
MTARIYCPAASATQSAPGVKQPWALRFDSETARAVDPLMGWTSSSDMKSQINLTFDSKEEAIAYAERNGLPYRVEEPKPAKAWRRIASYADNFRTSRVGLWTH